jgi:hypothetical protein
MAMTLMFSLGAGVPHMPILHAFWFHDGKTSDLCWAVVTQPRKSEKPMFPLAINADAIVMLPAVEGSAEVI